MLAQTEERFDGPPNIQRTRYGDNVIVFQFSGELDLATTPDAWRMIEPALDETGAMLVIDLTDLEFIDAKGIELLYGLAGARADKETLRLLSSTHDCVNRMLELTGVPEAITTIPA